MPTIDDYVKLPDGTWGLRSAVADSKECKRLVVFRHIEGCELLDDIVAFIRRFVVLSVQQAEAIALWVVHTFAFDQADATPYLNIHSPEKRSGKTRLLEVLELIVARPWFTGRVTAAVLARKVDAECPTLLLDESDAAFKGDKEYSETLRGLLNSGYRKGGKCSVCVGQGAKITYKDLSTFCPKAIAGIGKLPDTVADRSIPIVLKRRSSSEPVERFRRRIVEAEAQELHKRISLWVDPTTLAGIEPAIPEQLDDRASDCWEPLLAIADAAGANWPEKARKAAVALMTGEAREDDSLGIRLLSDIKTIFQSEDEQIRSSELVTKLIQVEESPWDNIDARPINTKKLAALLKPYDIRPKTIRLNDDTFKGYRQADFIDAWHRYLPLPPNLSVTPSQPDVSQIQNDGQIDPSQTTPFTPNVTDDSQSCAVANVTGVTDKTTETDETEQNSDTWEKDI